MSSKQIPELSVHWRRRRIRWGWWKWYSYRKSTGRALRRASSTNGRVPEALAVEIENGQTQNQSTALPGDLLYPLCLHPSTKENKSTKVKRSSQYLSFFTSKSQLIHPSFYSDALMICNQKQFNQSFCTVDIQSKLKVVVFTSMWQCYYHHRTLVFIRAQQTLAKQN